MSTDNNKSHAQQQCEVRGAECVVKAEETTAPNGKPFPTVLKISDQLATGSLFFMLLLSLLRTTHHALRTAVAYALFYRFMQKTFRRQVFPVSCPSHE